MQVDQYVYFALKSEHMSAAEMAARLGLEPDKITIRGSRRAEPPHPVVHIWQINGPRSSETPVDDLISALLDRLEPHADAIGELALQEPERTPVLQIVRRFRPDDAPLPTRSLGWHLNRRVLDFLRTTHAELDVDEYGYDAGSAP